MQGGDSAATWRQAEPDAGHALGIAAGVLSVYFVAGFYVYWLKTGSWTIGVGGKLSDLGGLVWFGPRLAWMGSTSSGREECSHGSGDRGPR